jgi:hypothetical protein
MLKDLHHIRYRRGLFSTDDYFLSPVVKLDADINYCIQCPENTNNALHEFYTLLIDLNQSIETIRNGIYHRTLAEINSFTANQVYEYKLLWDPSEEDLDHFVSLFNVFALQKKIRKAERSRLRAYRKHGILAISYIKQKEKFLCINFYRVTRQRASNLYSFIPSERIPSFTATHLGRAHRCLHWSDIMEFKEAGVNYYDLCGWYAGTENKELLNINKFKEQFSKNKVKEYSGVIYKNRLLRLLLKLIR